MINDPGTTGAWLSVAFWRVVSVPKSTYSPATVWTARAWTTFRRTSETTGGGSNWPWTIRSRSQSRPKEGSRPRGAPGFQTGGTVSTTTPLWARRRVLSETTGAVWNDPEPPSYVSQTRVGVGTAGRGVSPPEATGAGVPAGVTTLNPIDTWI